MPLSDYAKPNNQTVVDSPTALTRPHRPSTYARKLVKTISKDIPFKTIEIPDDTLTQHTAQVTYSGKMGTIETEIIQYLDTDNHVLYESKNIIDYHAPRAKIVRIGTIPAREQNQYFTDDYKGLRQFATPIVPSEQPLVGFDDLMVTISMFLQKEGMSNALLTADPGMGKTALMQYYAALHKDDTYVFTVSMAAMNEHERLPQNLELLFNDLTAYKEALDDENSDIHKDIILFIDEFHQWPMFSPASIESLKPQLARSAQLGIHIVGALTYDEYRTHIRPNRAFKERFPRLNMPSLTDDQVYEVLKNQISRSPLVSIEDDAVKAMLRKIIHNANLYMQDQAQPRKSMDILDDCLAYVKIGAYEFDDRVLERVFFDVANVHLNFNFDAKNLKSTLAKRVYGQQYAIDKISGRAYSIMQGVVNENRPLGVFMFQGSTGVGKTELTKALGDTLFGKNISIMQYDMSEYPESDETAPMRFKTRMTDDRIERNSNIFLLDEIEKAHSEIPKLLYSTFDEGRLSDKTGRPTSFTNVLFIMTTNVGEDISAEFGYRELTDDEAVVQLERSQARLRQILDKQFPKAFLGRLTALVPFAPLSDATYRKIANRALDDVVTIFKRNTGINVTFEREDVINYVTFEKFSKDANDGGARQIGRLIDADIVDAISQFTLFNPNVFNVTVRVVGDTMRDQHLNVTKAKIEIVDTESLIASEKNAPTELIIDQTVKDVSQDFLGIEAEYDVLNKVIQEASQHYNVAIQIHDYNKLLDALHEEGNFGFIANHTQLKALFTKHLDEYFRILIYQPQEAFTVGTVKGKVKILRDSDYDEKE